MAETTSGDLKDSSSAHHTLNDRQIQTLYDALEADDIGLAVRILGFIGDSKNLRAVGPLTVLLEYPDDTIQGNSAIALGKIGDKSAIGPMTVALKKSSDAVKVSIVIALGMFEDKSVIGAIESVQLTPDEPKLINTVRSTVFKLKHLDDPKEKMFPPDAADGRQEPPVEAPRMEAKFTVDIGQKPSEPKVPLLSAVLSFIVPGLGQVYNGEGYKKGLTYLFGIYIGYLFLLIPGMAVWIYSVYKAYTTAKDINEGLVSSTPPSLLGIILYVIVAWIIVPFIFTIILSLIIAAFVFGMVGTTSK